jgi:uroporphyrinogen-III synthase
MTDQPQQSRPKARKALLFLALAAVVGASVATYPQWKGQIQAFLPQAGEGFELENLRAELSAATARIAQLESRQLQAANAEAPALGDMDAISKQIADLRRSAVDPATILRLTDRLDQVEAGLRELQARRAQAGALLLAAGQLKDAVSMGRAYDAELRALRLLGGEDGDIARAAESLKPSATTGIAPFAVLVGRFDPLAARIVRAEILPAGDSWWKKTAERLLTLVTIRREDGAVAGIDTAALVARAQAALGRGDLTGAVAELDKLDPGPAEVALPWLTEAKARVAADRALSDLAAQCLALAGKGAP